jgi:hypothetical protein
MKGTAMRHGLEIAQGQLRRRHQVTIRGSLQRNARTI